MTDDQQPADAIDELQEDWAAQGADPDRDALGVVLRIQALARTLADQLSERLGVLGLAWWQYDVLSALRRQGPPYALSASALAEAGALSTGALTTRIDGLLELGLVERHRDAGDRRRVLVSLTHEGRRLADEAAKVRFEAAERALAKLEPRDRARLNALLRQLLGDQEQTGQDREGHLT